MRQQRGDAESRLVEVELVDEESPLAVVAAEHARRFGLEPRDPAPAAADDAPSGGGRASRRLRVLGIAVVAALVAITIGANVVASQREAARQAELAGHPWILPAVDGPLQEVWQVEGPQLLAESPGLVVASDLRGAVTAIDTATGRALWTWEGTEQRERCAGVQETDEQPAGAGLATEYLVCLPESDYFLDHRPPVPGAVAAVTLLDPVTGDVLGRADIEGTPLAWDVVGDHLVVTFVRSDAAVGIVRWDPQAGRQVWDFASDPGLMPDGLYSEWGYLLRDGVVHVVSGETAIAVAVESGEQVASDTGAFRRAAELNRTVLADGGTVEWRRDDVGEDGSGRVVEPDGSARFEFEGIPWRALRSDGSAPGVFVVQRAGSNGLVGLDARSGERLWRTVAGRERPWPVLQTGGIVVAVGGGTAAAIDLRDGERVWTLEVAPTPGPAVVTDGTVVLLPVREGWETSLVAVDLASGTELWRIPVRSGVMELYPAADGTVLLVTPNRIIAYR